MFNWHNEHLLLKQNKRSPLFEKENMISDMSLSFKMETVLIKEKL